MATGKALPGNSTVSACRLTASSRLLLLGKSRLYAPKDVQVSGILVYTRLKKKKFNLAKPPTLQENEDLLLRLDTIEYDGEVNGVSLETTLGHFKTGFKPVFSSSVVLLESLQLCWDRNSQQDPCFLSVPYTMK
ncbi:unnamed protein product [Durusdinium trenchii]|uniref:Uncharacterized protein n=1 Tax=Durusdinium trenchii TaxID=1381693 RepID=A0ABP0KXF7_9DINO